MTDVTASLFCQVHGEVTLHALLSDRLYECMETIGSAGVCGEVREARREDEDAYGEVREAPQCATCGAYADPRSIAEPFPHCWQCAMPLRLNPDAEEAL